MTVWNGVSPAVTTKLKPSGAIDLEWTQRSIDRLIDAGVSGVIVLPMLGENASLAMDERGTVIRAAREAVGGRLPLEGAERESVTAVIRETIEKLAGTEAAAPVRAAS